MAVADSMSAMAEVHFSAIGLYELKPAPVSLVVVGPVDETAAQDWVDANIPGALTILKPGPVDDGAAR